MCVRPACACLLFLIGALLLLLASLISPAAPHAALRARGFHSVPRSAPRDTRDAASTDSSRTLSFLAAGADADPPADEDLIASCYRGDASLAALLLADPARARLVNARTATRGTALILAAERGHAAVIRVLLAAGADFELNDVYGGTALFCAASAGHYDAVEALLAAGASQRVRRINDFASPLLRAARHGHKRVVDLLVSQVGAAAPDVDARDKQGRTAVMYAAQLGALDIVNALVAGGADVTLRSSDDVTAARWARERKHDDILLALGAAAKKAGGG